MADVSYPIGNNFSIETFQSEIIHKALFGKYPYGILAFDSEIKLFVFANKAVCRMLGYSQKQLLRKKLTNIHPVDSIRLIEKKIKLLKYQDKTFTVILPCIRKNKTIFHAEVIVSTIWLHKRKYVIGFFTDITGRMIPDELSQKSDEKYHHIIVDYASALEFWRNPDGSFRYISPSCETITGYTAKEFLANPAKFYDIVHPDDRLQVWNRFSMGIDTDKSSVFNFRIIKHSGETLWMEHRCIPAFNYEGKSQGRRVSDRESDEFKRAENDIRQLNRHILNMQEEERHRIEKDLHDGVSQTILAAKLNFVIYQKNPTVFPECLTKGLDLIDVALREIREICTDIFPAMLKDIGLIATIQWLANNMLQIKGINVRLFLSPGMIISNDHQMNLYRIIQELFSNIIKHSSADQVTVILEKANSNIILIVEDNGCGFELTKAKKERLSGFGLCNIRQRIERIKGLLSIQTSPGGGTKIRISIKEKTSEQNQDFYCG